MRVEVTDSRICIGTVSLELIPGQIHFVTGPNGSGKSTILRALAARRPDSREQTRWLSAPPERVVYVPQHACDMLHPLFRINDYLGDIARAWSLEQADFHSKLSANLDALRVRDVSRLLKSYPTDVSGGERQRIVIAAALSVDAELLLLDEPFSNVQPALRAEGFGLVGRRILAGACCLAVTHDTELHHQFSPAPAVELLP